jgi:integrase
VRHNQPTGIKLKNVERKGGRVIFPKDVLSLKKQLDANIVLGKWEFKAQPKRSVPISEILTMFLESEGATRSRGTRRNYELAVKKIKDRFGDISIGMLTEEKMFEWRQQTLASDKEQNTAMYLRHLGPILNWAVRKNYLASSPLVKGMKLNPVVRPPVIYTDKQLEKLLSESKKSDRGLHNQLMFLSLTGFRIGEACNLKWDDVDLHGGQINVHNEKEKRVDAFPIDPILRRFLRSLPRETEYVLRYRDRAKVSRLLKEITRRLGYSEDLSVHSIRKTFGSRLVRKGVDFAIAHKLMRHRNPSTTLKYYIWFGMDTLRKGLQLSR